MAVAEFQGVSRVYTSGDHELRALDKVDMKLENGKFVVILGPSGAGKSTLLNLLGGLDSPTEGKIIVDGRDISTLTDDELAEYRAEKVGFVFQFYNLIPTLTVHENVKLVDEIVKNSLSSTKMLEEVGLSDHLKNFPAELSGGEQQRVSIARALAKNPKILLCDEPTGALDSETGVIVLKLLLRMARERLELRLDLLHDVLHAQQVVLGIRELPHRLALAVAELRDARRLLEEGAAILRAAVEDILHAVLADDAHAVVTDARIREELVDILEAAARTVDEVLALATAVEAARHRHLAEIDGQRAVVVEDQRDFRNVERAPLRRAREDDVLRARAAQGE